MKTHKPILFSTEMVKAILEGRKTQTRRIVKPQPDFNVAWKNLGFSQKFGIETQLEIPNIDLSGNFIGVSSPIEIDGMKATGLCIPNIPIKIHKGDILWVRESFCKISENNFEYKSGFTDEPIKWKPSIHMPKEAARIFLEVTNVSVERLQDISRSDARSEGVKFENNGEHNYYYNYLEDRFSCDALYSFMTLWIKINGFNSFKTNPWVWVYEFKQVEKPKDFLNE